jgi:DNA segregation ATPase FtsK/SpoIIIE-like protein
MLDQLVNHSTTGMLARNDLFAKVAEERKRVIRNIDEYDAITGDVLPRIFAFVDEINSLLADAVKDARLTSFLTQALQMGASAGFYLLGGGQQLTANILPTDAQNQFVTRAHFGAYTQSAIAMLFGSVDEDVFKPLLDGTPGRGIIRTVGRAESATVSSASLR